MERLNKIVEFIRFVNLDLDVSEISIFNGYHNLEIEGYNVVWLQDANRYQLYNRDIKTYPNLDSFDNEFDVVSYIVISLTKKNLKSLELKYKEQSNK